MVIVGGVGSGRSASSSYVPLMGLFLGGRPGPSIRTGDTSLRRRRREVEAAVAIWTGGWDIDWVCAESWRSMVTAVEGGDRWNMSVVEPVHERGSTGSEDFWREEADGIQDAMRKAYRHQSPIICRERPSCCAASGMTGQRSNVVGHLSGGTESIINCLMLAMI